MNGPPTMLRDRILESTAARPSATRKTHRQRRLAVMLLLLAFVVGSSSILAGRHADIPPRPLAYLVTILAASVVVAVLTAYYTLGPTTSPIGHSGRFHRILTIATPCILSIAAIAANLIAPTTFAGPNAPNMAHLACATTTFITGAAVLVVLLALERRSATTSAMSKGASFGAVAAAWATLFISISCPFADPEHVVPTHILIPLVLLVGGGMAAGARVLAMRTDRASNSR